MVELEEIKTWDIEKLWNFISVEQSLDRKVYNIVRFGHTIKMDINDYIRNAYLEKTKAGKIVYGSKTFNREDLYTDIERRRKEAFRWIEKNFPDKSVIGARYAPE